MNERVKQWLSFADDDLKTARLVLKEAIYNQACFHSQQCAEKCLKALLESKGKVPKVHRLLELLTICQESGFDIEKWRPHLEFLDKFYTVSRYPFIVGNLPGGLPLKEDADKAVKMAEGIFKTTNNILAIIP